MNHLMRFDELCLRLIAVGETIDDHDKLVNRLGSLHPEYDILIRFIEATSGVTLMGAKEMLQQEYATLKEVLTRRWRSGCGSLQKGSYHRTGQPHDSNNARQGVQFKGRC